MKSFSKICFAVFVVSLVHALDAFAPPLGGGRQFRGSHATMAMEPFFERKLDSIQRTFDGLAERLADPDMSSDRKAMVSRLLIRSKTAYKSYKACLSICIMYVCLSMSVSLSIQSTVYSVHLQHH